MLRWLLATAASGDLEVVFEADSMEQAGSRCSEAFPDLVLLDLTTPELDGVGIARLIMRTAPCPVLLLARSVSAEPAPVFDAIGAGAAGAVDLPAPGPDGGLEGVEAFLARVRTFAMLAPSRVDARPPRASGTGEEPSCLIALGASAGGPSALAAVLGSLPVDLPAAVAIVQHIDEQFSGELATWLGGVTPLPVRRAEEGERMRSGVVYVGARNDHLYLRDRFTFGYRSDPTELSYRPSIDVFFRSVGRFWGSRAIGVVLSGMGRDGAEGLLELRERGAFTIAQDQASSAVYGIPKAANDLRAAVEVLPLARIADRIQQVLRLFPSTRRSS